MKAEKLLEALYEAKALVGIYSGYAKSSPSSGLELRSAEREMRHAKSALLKQLGELGKELKRLEAAVKPA